MVIEINKTGFGYIIINNTKYEHDVIINPNGNVMKRKKELSSRYRRLFNHTPLSKEELEYYLNNTDRIDYIIIGTGQYGLMPIRDDAKQLIEELVKKGVKVIIDKTPNVVSRANALYSEGKKVLAILHVTC